MAPFPPVRLTTVRRSPPRLVLADFNQDGRLDMAVANQNAFANRDVSVYPGQCGRDVSRTRSITLPVPVARSIIVGDFNADSRLDLAVANEQRRTVSVLLGNADGTFAAALNIPVGTVPQPSRALSRKRCRAGDFNGDGRLDLVVSVHFRLSGLVLPGNGDGTFGAAITFTTTAGLDGGLTVGHEVAVGDFNADGKLDIVASQSGAQQFLHRGGRSERSVGQWRLHLPRRRDLLRSL